MTTTEMLHYMLVYWFGTTEVPKHLSDAVITWQMRGMGFSQEEIDILLKERKTQ